MEVLNGKESRADASLMGRYSEAMPVSIASVGSASTFLPDLHTAITANSIMETIATAPKNNGSAFEETVETDASAAVESTWAARRWPRGAASFASVSNRFPNSHNDPEQPGGHSHFPVNALHLPPFLQTLFAHRPISQNVPEKPAGQVQQPALHFPPFLHPTVVQGPISQNVPEKPAGQVQQPASQMPPFLHPTVVQGPISQNVPEKPAGQVHLPALHFPPFLQPTVVQGPVGLGEGSGLREAAGLCDAAGLAEATGL
jgi:hypothetical protein